MICPALSGPGSSAHTPLCPPRFPRQASPTPPVPTARGARGARGGCKEERVGGLTAKDLGGGRGGGGVWRHEVCCAAAHWNDVLWYMCVFMLGTAHMTSFVVCL
jgi:hypothetical protein